jgi:hypothetical protein
MKTTFPSLEPIKKKIREQPWFADKVTQRLIQPEFMAKSVDLSEDQVREQAESEQMCIEMNAYTEALWVYQMCNSPACGCRDYENCPICAKVLEEILVHKNF